MLIPITGTSSPILRRHHPQWLSQYLFRCAWVLFDIFSKKVATPPRTASKLSVSSPRQAKSLDSPDRRGFSIFQYSPRNSSMISETGLPFTPSAHINRKRASKSGHSTACRFGLADLSVAKALPLLVISTTSPVSIHFEIRANLFRKSATDARLMIDFISEAWRVQPPAPYRESRGVW